MGKNKYKIIIFGKNIYREYSLSDFESNIVKVGTTKGCQVRFKKERFFEDFEFELLRHADGFEINCTNSVYFTIDGIMKLYNKDLQHGDEIIIKYENYNETVFKLNFLIDFDSIQRNYDRVIDLKEVKKVTIGGSEKDTIYIQDDLLKQGNVTLFLRDNKYYIKDNNTKYGVYKNTQKINKETQLKDCDFLIIMRYYFYFKNNKLYTDKNENMHILGLKFTDKIYTNKLKYPKFNRSTRIKYITPNTDIEVLPPEKLPNPPKNNILITLIPALAMVALIIVLRGVIGNGGSFVIYSVATMSIGIIMSIVNSINTKKEYKREVEKRKTNYLKYIEEKANFIENMREKELKVLKKKYISLEENVKNVREFNKELFDRSKEDEDFLEVTLGYGTVASRCEVKITPQKFKDTTDELVDKPEEIENKYKFIDNAPVILKLASANAVGILGNYKNLCRMLKNVTVDIIGRHFYKDVKMFYVFNEENKAEFQWLRWIKHIYNEDIGVRNLIYDEESKNSLFEYLYIQLIKREEEIKSNKGDFYTHFVIFVVDDKGIKNHPISRFIKSSSKLGTTFIFFNESQELLPMGCSEIIRLDENGTSAEIVNCNNGECITGFTYKNIDYVDLNELALRLAPIYVDEVSLESQLTKNISLFELLGVTVVDEIDIEKRWKESKVYKSMAAPLGVKTKGQIIYLDLNEKKHGPHGLVAGTTGSGKSEILQSYILSMCTLFHPYEVGFVIIDFKGGGMVNQFKDLPHLVGSITNIDGREINRSLSSIKAELTKRQALFAEYGVNHIDAYIKKFKSGEISKPLPHLILIVDEFAELKSDQPEFMKELISAARIGRSLGVHLILATQKPSGVIDDQIWSNSKFKLCLKVQNQSDSNEVLKSPLAAEIKEPGRAYLQVGNNEVFELFQSAYSGAEALRDEMGNNKEFEINEVALWGKRTTIFKREKKKNSGTSATQLEALVKYINEYCLENNIEKLPGICLPPLPDVILLKEGEKLHKNNTCVEAFIGIYDDPTKQLQAPVRVNISEGNLFIVGSSQFGKTSLLQTIIRTVAESYTPEEVNMYILDFASMILKNFQGLKHVGGVITSSDDEKLKTFTTMMLKEIEHRKSVLSKLGISSFVSYREAGYKDMCQIIIFLDNMTAFKEMYSERDEELLNICREGVAVGITVIIANAQTTGIGYKYMTNFSSRIALYCNDSSEYGSLFDRCRMQPKNIPGRGLISIDKDIYEYQSYLAFIGEKEIDRVKDMKSFIEHIKLKYPNMKAKIIPEIPEVLDMKFIKENYGKKQLAAYEIPIGLNYETINLETINLLKESSMAIIGKENKGKSNFIASIAQNVQRKILENPVQVYVVDNIEKKLSFMKEYGFVEKYSLLFNDLELIIEEVYDELEYRSEKVAENGMEILKNEPLIVIINNNRDAMNSLGANKEVMNKYKKITSQFKNLKVCIIFNDVENSQVGFTASELLKSLKEGNNGFIFDDVGDNKFFDLPINISRNYKKPLSLGDAYWIDSGEFKKLKTILKD